MTAGAPARQPDPTPISELETLRQFAGGDIGAFETLFRRYQGEVYRWIVRIVRDTAVAEDLTIEAFWRVYRAHARFDPERTFIAWARRIASNVAIDHLKTVRPEAELKLDIAAAPVDRVLQEHVRNQTAMAFQRLPAKLRVVASLALIEERPYKEIAEALGISLNAVKTRVFRAVRSLRKDLEQLGVKP